MGDNSIELRETLALQLAEVEMLASMYANDGELAMDDPTAVPDIQSFIDGNSEYSQLNSRIRFTLKLHVGDASKNELEVTCNLSHDYPRTGPDIFLRCTELSRTEHQQLCEKLTLYIAELDRGEICLGSVIQWLEENAEDHIRASQTEIAIHKPTNTQQPGTENIFCRMWIYSHHIYNKVKRKDILEYAHDLQLTGFCVPGKPGMVVIEGLNRNVEDFWQRIRRMTWKRIVMKEKEDHEMAEGQTVDDYRKFEGFEEKWFEPRQVKGRRGAHMDRGMLFQYLDEHGFGYIFPIYFEVSGKQADDPVSD